MTVKKVAKAINVESAPNVFLQDRFFNLGGMNPVLSPEGRLLLQVPVLHIPAPVLSEDYHKGLIAAGFTSNEITDELECFMQALDKKLLIKAFLDRME